MRCIAILLCVVASSVTIQATNLQRIAEILDVPVDQLQECLRENHFNDGVAEDIENIFRDAMLSLENTEEVMKNIGCFVSCTFEKSNIMNNGEIQLDTVLRIAERNDFTINAQTTEKLEDCIDRVKDQTDKCSTALAFSTCFLQQIGHR